jgi:dolichyl-phosphate-mannose--protein O-mannosyl transferase
MKNNSLISNFLLLSLFGVVLLVCIYIIFAWKNNKKDKFMNDYFDCYLKLTDINPQFVNAYMKYDNKHVSNGICENARLHVVVEPCPTDSNGIPSDKCRETVVLKSSKGNPVEFPYSLSPMNVGKYFGINA